MPGFFLGVKMGKGGWGVGGLGTNIQNKNEKLFYDKYYILVITDWFWRVICKKK